MRIGKVRCFAVELKGKAAKKFSLKLKCIPMKANLHTFCDMQVCILQSSDLQVKAGQHYFRFVKQIAAEV